MAFWSAARLLETSFFCKVTLSAKIISRATTSVATCVSSYLGGLALLEESLFTSLLLSLLGGEVLGSRNLLDLGLVDASKVDLERGGDDVSGVDTAKGNTVDLEGTGDEENTVVEGLEEDDTLATEATGQKNQDGTGLEGAAGSPRAEGLAGLKKRSMLEPDISNFLLLCWKSRLISQSTAQSRKDSITSRLTQIHHLTNLHIRGIPIFAFIVAPGQCVLSCIPATTSRIDTIPPKSHPGHLVMFVSWLQIGMHRSKRTLRGWASSSAGYHFWAFSDAAGTVRVDLPKVFVVGAADIVRALAVWYG
jgi:hypothetical protein